MTSPETPHAEEANMTVARDISAQTLRDLLIAGNIPLEAYGKNNAKTIGHLLKEINDGESVVTVDASGNLHRFVDVLWVDVLCARGNGDIFLLHEDRQEFKDGRTKRRFLDSSLGEKLKPGEAPEAGAARALEEELGVAEIDALYRTGYDEKTLVPDTFPGLESSYKMHKFASIIPEEAFDPDGYVEYQTDKTNYYLWTRIYTPTDG